MRLKINVDRPTAIVDELWPQKQTVENKEKTIIHEIKGRIETAGHGYDYFSSEAEAEGY